MTPDEMTRELGLAIGRTRLRTIEAMGVSIVACIEGMGFVVVPAWVVEALAKVMKRAGEGTSPGEGDGT